MEMNQMRKYMRLFENEQILYHATYRPYLQSIMAQGLHGNSGNKNWEDSQDDSVYLSTDYNIAQSFAETSDSIPDEYFDEIIVLGIDRKQLDQKLLILDRNIQDNDGYSFEYRGVIPPSAINQGVISPSDINSQDHTFPTD
jgi:hypothetical protein